MNNKEVDNTFILDLQKSKKDINPKRSDKIMCKVVRAFNSSNKKLKLKFREDNLNRYFGIKYSKYDYYENLLDGNMINIEQAVNIYHLLTQILLLKIPGDVVEVGCFKGITSILIQKTLDQYNSKKELHVYDAFQGLPEKTSKDGQTYFKKGFCKCNVQDLIRNFKKFKVKLPKIHEGWFVDTLPTKLPKKICFAHLDGDFYSPTKEGLEYLYPKLAKGAIVVIDDYCDPKILNVHNILPGVKKACDKFFKNKKEKINVLICGMQSHGYFRKK